MSLEVISQHKAFGGTVGFYRHASACNACNMQFSVFTPPQAATRKVPVVTWLSGLTCTEETFMIKAGAQRVASELGLMLVAPDTSPRGKHVPDDPDGEYDFGLGAGFYLNATEAPWRENYRMYDYIVTELSSLIFEEFPANGERQGIFGHSMGGHGALTIGLRNPNAYRSISAFAPVANPSVCPWGVKALGHYLGADRSAWRQYDATELARSVTDKPQSALLIDQGLSDAFLEEQLFPQNFAEACRDNAIDLTLRQQDGYDHGYYFIASFIEDHLRHHAACLLD